VVGWCGLGGWWLMDWMSCLSVGRMANE
jgi:hypothetical protein